MSQIEMRGIVDPQIEAEGKFSQLQRLVALDSALSGIISQHNQLFYHEGIPTSQDVIEAMQFTRAIVRRAIFSTWKYLVDMKSPRASNAINMITLSTASQNGEIGAVVIGDQIQATNETTVFLRKQIGIRNTQVKPHGWPG